MTCTCRGPIDLPSLGTAHQQFDRTGLASSPCTYRGLNPLAHTIKPFLHPTSPLPPPSMPGASPAPALYSPDPAPEPSKRPLPSTHPTLPLNQATPFRIAQECRLPHPPPIMATSPDSSTRPVSRAISVWFISLASACTAGAVAGAPPYSASAGENSAAWVLWHSNTTGARDPPCKRPPAEAAPPLLPQPAGPPPRMQAEAVEAASRRRPRGTRLRDALVFERLLERTC